MTAGPGLDPDDLPALFAAAPAPLLVLRPDAPAFSIVAATDAYLSASLQTPDTLVGRPVFEALPDANPGGQRHRVMPGPFIPAHRQSHLVLAPEVVESMQAADRRGRYSR